MRCLTFLFFIQSAFCFAMTSLSISSDVSQVTTKLTLASTSTHCAAQWTPTPSVTAVQIPISPSAVVTLAPLVANPLEKRQRCWDDRGFSVDCATWTGYYYTWGPPGNPYAGGPGEGGGGSGGGGNGAATVVVYQSGTSRLDLLSWPGILGLLCLGFVLFL